MSSRWKILDRTSPSGKPLFECQNCGRVSPTPDKRCFGPKQCGMDEEEMLGRLADFQDRLRGLRR